VDLCDTALGAGTCVTTLTCLLSQIKLRLKSLLSERQGSSFGDSIL